MGNAPTGSLTAATSLGEGGFARFPLSAALCASGLVKGPLNRRGTYVARGVCYAP